MKTTFFSRPLPRSLTRPLALGLLALSAAACKDQLREYNPSGATAEAVFTTPDGIETAVNGVYTYNRVLYGKEAGYALLEMGTDIWTAAANNGSTVVSGAAPQPALTSYQGLQSDNIWVKAQLWQQCYAAINLANQALKYVGSAGLSTARRPQAEAELRFMRAWYYYHLAESFGDVPLNLEPTESVVTTATRTPVAQVYDQVFQDLTFALANLPVTTTDYGRITRPAAEGFAAKVYLTRGQYQRAANLAKRVVTQYSGNGISLVANYADLWDINKQRNSEVLWAVNYSPTLTFNAGSNLGHTFFLMDYGTLPGMQRDIPNGFANVRYMPTRFLLNLYNEQNDARYLGSFKQAWLANNAATIPKWSAAEIAQNPTGLAGLLNQSKFTLGDTAVLVTKRVIPTFNKLYTRRYRYRVYDLNDVYNTDGTPKDRFHYVSLRKFDDPTRATATVTESARDANILRLGDIYLIAAEAQVRLNKTDSAAYYINQVRTRAALPGRTAAMQVTASQVTLDFVLDERARELAGEQVRWLDLKRAGKLVERVKTNNPDAGASIQDFHNLRPIPQSDLDAVTNKADFRQNPGY
jgi:hypothetical protein